MYTVDFVTVTISRQVNNVYVCVKVELFEQTASNYGRVAIKCVEIGHSIRLLRGAYSPVKKLVIVGDLQ